MRISLSLLAALVLLALPATASAHHTYHNVTFAHTTGYYEDINDTSLPVATPGCGEHVTIAPGQVTYVRRFDRTFGISQIQSLSEIHATTYDEESISQGLRWFQGPFGTGTAHELASRNPIHVNPFGQDWTAIRFRNNSPTYAYWVTRNC